VEKMSKSYFNRTALEAIHKECLDLGARKNHDYGAAGDAIEMAGVSGVVVRMLDKQLRLMSLTKPNHDQAVKDESIRDTLMDMINYATYAVSLIDGSWGKKPTINIVNEEKRLKYERLRQNMSRDI
jgi:Nucleotide modification associated domain 1